MTCKQGWISLTNPSQNVFSFCWRFFFSTSQECFPPFGLWRVRMGVYNTEGDMEYLEDIFFYVNSSTSFFSALYALTHKLHALISNFRYACTYIVEQNSCSSARIIFAPLCVSCVYTYLRVRAFSRVFVYTVLYYPADVKKGLSSYFDNRCNHAWYDTTPGDVGLSDQLPPIKSYDMQVQGFVAGCLLAIFPPPEAKLLGSFPELHTCHMLLVQREVYHKFLSD